MMRMPITGSPCPARLVRAIHMACLYKPFIRARRDLKATFMFRRVNHSLSGVTPGSAWQGLSGNENRSQQVAKRPVATENRLQ
jgi:hypothetical protein